jgi:hypothetical protein
LFLTDKAQQLFPATSESRMILVEGDPLASGTAALSRAGGLILILVVAVVTKNILIVGAGLRFSMGARGCRVGSVPIVVTLNVGFIGIGRNLSRRLLCLICGIG